jgi:hypothetical protein
MASAIQSSFFNERISSIERDANYETYSLIWLDALVHSKENVDAQEKLRVWINYLQAFDKLHECEKYVRSVPSEDRIVLIISDHFGQQLIPNIHSFRQVLSIYIYCGNKQFDQEWIKQYRKVILVF